MYGKLLKRKKENRSNWMHNIGTLNIYVNINTDEPGEFERMQLSKRIKGFLRESHCIPHQYKSADRVYNRYVSHVYNYILDPIQIRIKYVYDKHFYKNIL